MVADDNGGFNVVGSHTYAEKMTGVAFSVSVADKGGASTGASTGAFAVADTALTAGALTSPTAAAGAPVTNLTLFHFADADLNGTVADYTATVTWGDGAVEDGAHNPADVKVVADADGGFGVVGSHTYMRGATGLTFQVQVQDAGGASVGGSAVLNVSGDGVVNGAAGDDSLSIGQPGGGGANSIIYNFNGSIVSLTNVTFFTFNGGGGNDHLIVYVPAGGSLMSGAVSFHGGGANGMTVVAGGLPVQTGPGVIVVGNQQTVHHDNLQGLLVEDAFAVNGMYGPDTRDRPTALAGLTPDQRFVQALYLDALGRPASPGERGSWTAVFSIPGLTHAQAQAEVAYGVEQLQEAEIHIVATWAAAYLGRPFQAGDMAYVNSLAAGQTEEQVLSTILALPEFYARARALFPAATADTSYVEALYELLMHCAGTAAEVSTIAPQAATLGRQAIALGFLQSQEFRTDQFEGYYDALLHRPGNAPFDPSGLTDYVFSGYDMETVRILLEAQNEFYFNGRGRPAANDSRPPPAMNAPSSGPVNAADCRAGLNILAQEPVGPDPSPEGDP